MQQFLRVPQSVSQLMKLLKPVSGFALPGNFSEAQRLLCRPVIQISEEQYRALYARGCSEKCDVYEFRGGWVTYGSADGGYALWPLICKPPKGLHASSSEHLQ